MYSNVRRSRVEGLLLFLLIFEKNSLITCINLYVFFKDEELGMQYKKDIYRKVCDSGWIGSSCKDFKLSVFDMLYDLFKRDDIDIEHCRMFK